MQASIDAGSGPMRAPNGTSARFTRPPIAPGCTRTRRPSSSGSIVRQPWPTSTSRPSVIACPDRLVPAARNVTGMRDRRENAKSARTSSIDSGLRTARGTSR